MQTHCVDDLDVARLREHTLKDGVEGLQQGVVAVLEVVSEQPNALLLLETLELGVEFLGVVSRCGTSLKVLDELTKLLEALLVARRRMDAVDGGRRRGRRTRNVGTAQAGRVRRGGVAAERADRVRASEGRTKAHCGSGMDDGVNG